MAGFTLPMDSMYGCTITTTDSIYSEGLVCSTGGMPWTGIRVNFSEQPPFMLLSVMDEQETCEGPKIFNSKISLRKPALRNFLLVLSSCLVFTPSSCDPLLQSLCWRMNDNDIRIGTYSHWELMPLILHGMQNYHSRLPLWHLAPIFLYLMGLLVWVPKSQA